MTRVYLGNAFSLQMLNVTVSNTVNIVPADVDEIADSNFMSVIGHADTAAVVSNILNRDVPANRASVRLEKGDILYVAQVTGGRLPEGATTLPEGFTLAFLKVTIQ